MEAYREYKTSERLQNLQQYRGILFILIDKALINKASNEFNRLMSKLHSTANMIIEERRRVYANN